MKNSNIFDGTIPANQYVASMLFQGPGSVEIKNQHTGSDTVDCYGLWIYDTINGIKVGMLHQLPHCINFVEIDAAGDLSLSRRSFGGYWSSDSLHTMYDTENVHVLITNDVAKMKEVINAVNNYNAFNS